MLQSRQEVNISGRRACQLASAGGIAKYSTE